MVQVLEQKLEVRAVVQRNVDELQSVAGAVRIWSAFDGRDRSLEDSRKRRRIHQDASLSSNRLSTRSESKYSFAISRAAFACLPGCPRIASNASAAPPTSLKANSPSPTGT